ARKDDRVKAIVLRINSGGGGTLPSEVIHREVELAAKIKPVVASFGNVAASGGYYIACPADTIVASETTITGSIGVFGMLPNFEELLEDKIGINTEVVKTNRHSDFPSPTRAMTAEERKLLQKSVDDFYITFVNKVVAGRGMTYEEVDAIGGGRVWSGISAMEIGLIDVFGGLEESIEIAAEMAGLDTYRISDLPVLEDPFTMIMNQLTGGIKAKILKRELGETYQVYKKIEELKNLKGTQAALPYTIEIH
ncbi:signal peptide peptidase SppA, partial [Bacteroidota bacterium]